MLKIRDLLQKYRSETDFRMKVSFFITLVFCVYEAICGIVYRSDWFGALAVYYILLAVARVALAVSAGHKPDPGAELRIYRLCGVCLLLITVALGTLAHRATFRGNAPHYPGHLIYAVAAFTFYNLTNAIIKFVNRRKQHSRLVAADTIISLATALMSMYMLQVAMLAAFGDSDAAFAQTANLVSCAVIHILILVMAFSMMFARSKAHHND